MEESGEIFAPAALQPGNDFRTYQQGTGWASQLLWMLLGKREAARPFRALNSYHPDLT